MQRSWRIGIVLVFAWTAAAGAQSKPPRLREATPPGQRYKLSLGTLYLPPTLPATGTLPVFLHFHGPGWIAEVAAAEVGTHAVLHAHLGAGSAVYGKPFAEAKRLRELLGEAEKASGRTFELVGLSGWSAGYGAVRAILRVEEYYREVQWVVLLDGLHAGYAGEKKPAEADLDCYIRFAKDAARGEKRFLITHTAIVPGKYASTTETADLLLEKVGATRAKATSVFGLPVETEARIGGLTVLGCAGTTAAPHVDHAHALPRLVESATRGYAEAVVVDDVPLVHTPQVLPSGKSGREAAGQVESVLDELAALLGRAQSDLDKVVRLNVYVARDDVVPVVQRALLKRYPGVRKPALSVVVGEVVEERVLVSVDAVATTSTPSPLTPLPLKGGEGNRTVAILPAGPVYYVSGQAERGKTLAESTRKTLESLEATLKWLGRGQGDVVQVKAFVHPMNQIADVRKEIRTWFGIAPIPPVTLVEWTTKNSIEIELVVAGGANKDRRAEAIEFLTPPGMKASPIYARVTRINHGKRVYTSGLTGTGKDVLDRLGVVLRAHGSDYRHMAKATYYVSTDESSALLNKIRPEYYDPKRPPAASKAPVRGIGVKGCDLLVDMIAVVP